MKRALFILLICCGFAGSYLVGDDGSNQFNVVPFEFDPASTHLVAATWKGGAGCPTNAATSSTGNSADGTFTDPACPTGDPHDKKVEGLVLAKTGPTANFAAAGATISGVKGIVLTELGYDIRKPGANQNDPRGSHCGAGAPRFNVVTSDGSFFIGCNSPPATTDTAGIGWQRLRWGGSAPLMGFNATSGALVPVTGAVKQLSIVFDEGQDPSGGPDQFGAAVLDNIDINGTLVGNGPTGAEQ